jgi:hypothetical protein
LLKLGLLKRITVGRLNISVGIKLKVDFGLFDHKQTAFWERLSHRVLGRLFLLTLLFLTNLLGFKFLTMRH